MFSSRLGSKQVTLNSSVVVGWTHSVWRLESPRFSRNFMWEVDLDRLELEYCWWHFDNRYIQRVKLHGGCLPKQRQSKGKLQTGDMDQTSQQIQLAAHLLPLQSRTRLLNICLDRFLVKLQVPGGMRISAVYVPQPQGTT